MLGPIAIKRPLGARQRYASWRVLSRYVLVAKCPKNLLVKTTYRPASRGGHGVEESCSKIWTAVDALLEDCGFRSMPYFNAASIAIDEFTITEAKVEDPRAWRNPLCRKFRSVPSIELRQKGQNTSICRQPPHVGIPSPRILHPKTGARPIRNAFRSYTGSSARVILVAISLKSGAGKELPRNCLYGVCAQHPRSRARVLSNTRGSQTRGFRVRDSWEGSGGLVHSWTAIDHTNPTSVWRCGVSRDLRLPCNDQAERSFDSQSGGLTCGNTDHSRTTSDA
jgi:hypothetical protein